MIIFSRNDCGMRCNWHDDGIYNLAYVNVLNMRCLEHRCV